jgi:uncharacterized protein (DUF1501 family)
MSRYIQQRRNFLKNAGMICAGLSTSASSIFQLKNLAAMSGQDLTNASDYKALVCVYLSGGADSFNMLVPRGQSEYGEYLATRSNLAINRDQLLSINPLNISGVEFGLHPMMPNIQQMFNQGEAAWLTNVGTLVKPVTKNDYINGNVPLPLGLFSHSDQGNQWLTASPSERSIKGWAGKISDLLYDTNTEQQISMNISFAGSNIFQKSNRNVEFSVNNNGAVTLDGYTDEMYGINPATKAAVDKMLSHNYNDPFKNTYKNLFRTSLDSAIRFNDIIDKTTPIATPFPDDYMANHFKMIAKIISARNELGFKRQIFFVDVGGWDNHDDLLNDQNYLLMKLDMALGAFNNALKEINMTDDVVTFTMSEFARTLTSNGNGTDHAWGGNVFAFGGPVRGNNLYGTFPSLAMDSSLDVGSGSLIPTMANDLYFAELALWFGVPQSELHTVLPNLHNFYAQGSTNNPLGFLDI